MALQSRFYVASDPEQTSYDGPFPYSHTNATLPVLPLSKSV